MTSFLVFKAVLALAAIAFAVREIIVAGRPDADPEFTAKLLRTFSAAERRRQQVPAAPATEPAPVAPAVAPANDPEAPRRAA
jgi:hypothetical protein